MVQSVDMIKLAKTTLQATLKKSRSLRKTVQIRQRQNHGVDTGQVTGQSLSSLLCIVDDGLILAMTRSVRAIYSYHSSRLYRGIHIHNNYYVSMFVARVAVVIRGHLRDGSKNEGARM